MNTYQAIGLRIRKARCQQRLTQAQFGQLLNPSVSYATVSDIERGKHKMDVDRLTRIGEVVGLTLPQLLGLPAEGEESARLAAIEQALEQILQWRLSANAAEAARLSAVALGISNGLTRIGEMLRSQPFRADGLTWEDYGIRPEEGGRTRAGGL